MRVPWDPCPFLPRARHPRVPLVQPSLLSLPSSILHVRTAPAPAAPSPDSIMSPALWFCHVQHLSQPPALLLEETWAGSSNLTIPPASIFKTTASAKLRRKYKLPSHGSGVQPPPSWGCCALSMGLGISQSLLHSLAQSVASLPPHPSRSWAPSLFSRWHLVPCCFPEGGVLACLLSALSEYPLGRHCPRCSGSRCCRPPPSAVPAAPTLDGCPSQERPSPPALRLTFPPSPDSPPVMFSSITQPSVMGASHLCMLHLYLTFSGAYKLPTGHGSSDKSFVLPKLAVMAC